MFIRQSAYRLFIFLLLLEGGNSFGQSYNFKNYTVEHGLPYIYINTIFQDSKGYLWSGGYGGLSKFDGISFQNFGTKNGLINHYVNAIDEDTKGRIIIGTFGGLSIYDKERFTNIDKKRGLPDNIVQAVMCDKHNNIWVGTKSGLAIINFAENTFKTFLKGEEILQIFCMETEVMVVCREKITRFSGNTNQPKEISQEINTLQLKQISVLPDKTCFAISDTGFFTGTNLNNWKSLPHPPLGGEVLNSIFTDAGKHVWIGFKGGLFRRNKKGIFERFKVSADPNANNIICITGDYEDNLWIGTHSGLFRFRDEGFSSYGPHDGLNNTMVFSVTEDLNGRIIAGTEDGGLYRLEDGRFKNISENKIKSKTVQGLCRDSSGRVWVGGDKGLYILQNDDFREIPAFAGKFIYSIYAPNANTIWVGCGTGVAQISDINHSQKITSFEVPVKSDKQQASGWATDNKGRTWVCIYMNGLYCIENGQIAEQSKTFNIRTEGVFEVKYDGNNTLYVASLDGIYVLNLENKTSTRITEEMGLNSDLVYSLLLTDNGQTLWAGTNQGANKIDLQKYRQNPKQKFIWPFGKMDGFKGVECNSGGLFKDSNNNIWFSTVSGLVKFNQKKYIENQKEPRLNLVKTRVFYADTIIDNGAEFSSSINNFSFSYIGICLSNPEKVRYVHKLDGFDKKWSPESNENIVRYSNLPPGQYTFMVKACNNEGIWTKEPLTLSFTILKPIWQRWWFIVTMLGLIAGIIVLIFRIRISQIKKEEERNTAQKIEAARMELKALRAQMNPHFLFNSLNSIQHYILNKKDDEAIYYLNKFARLMRIILNNSEKASVTIREETESLKLYLELEKMRFGGTFNYSLEIDPELDADFEEIPTMVIQPFVENAILHGLTPKKGGGTLSVRFEKRNSDLVCVIEDDGIGREKSAEIKNIQRREHKSMGMKLTTERIHLLNEINAYQYKIEITDLHDLMGHASGTKVEIYLPLNN